MSEAERGGSRSSMVRMREAWVEKGLARMVEGSRVSRGMRWVGRCIMVRGLLGGCVVVFSMKRWM
jgi:hypothetical protein